MGIHNVNDKIIMQTHLGVFSVAAGIMAMHYETVLEINGSCLIPSLFGDTETGMCCGFFCEHAAFH